MDLLYEVTLFVSLWLGLAALTLALRERFQAPRTAGAARWPLRLAAGAWIALAVSFTVHLAFGHTPGGPQALPLPRFIVNHRSFVVAALIPVLALIVRPGGRMRATDPRG